MYVTTTDCIYTCSRDFTVRFIPEWFPGAGFKRLARVARARGDHMVDGAFDAAKKAMNSEDSMPSLVGSLLTNEGPKEMTREEYEYTIKWAAGSLYGGAHHPHLFIRVAHRLLLASRNRVGMWMPVPVLRDVNLIPLRHRRRLALLRSY